MSFQCWNGQQVSYFRQEAQAYLEPSQKSKTEFYKQNNKKAPS